MAKIKNYLTNVTATGGENDKTPMKIELEYKEMPKTFGNWADSFCEAVQALDKICCAIEYIYSIQTHNEYQKELRKTVRTFLKWYRHTTLDKNSLAGVFRSKTVTASVIRRKRLVTITICETANTKFNVELYKKGEESN